MVILYKDDALRELCENEKRCKKTHGANAAKKLQRRLVELRVATDLSEIVCGRPHPLYGEFDGCIGLDLSDGLRLVIRPANEPLPLLSDGGLDRRSVTIVRIVFIGDYHD